jgi:hypothetical protein
MIALRPGDPEFSARNKAMTNVVRAGLFTEKLFPRWADVVAVEDKQRQNESTWPAER